ncbi:D-hexose-6-phosphate mutarotase [Photobacterium iliopiscarium]|uniref:D-hexose-6-phosphate mutarotase n=1 Tax=Photobacterium iliopiscarium TaxID=56192 RepID=UPI001E601488|nr:D-hexose-6-phosphate mutarotase [Photobacterium iliopiscarium]MCD9468637.1 D-hexose-6-phosphate mutarotase [Photobacterium iliopiscarium]MCD9488727.1 D-hexose-6-phosphate mutarotase [Photobacterium iliopiscarium]MCF2245454.1 D-hexose-6-phosphate mutarotase [Photobacterium iliopiscarium]
MDLRQLSIINALSDAVTVCEYQGIKIIRIIHPMVEAGISLHGGHLLWFKPTSEKDVIWLSENAEFDLTKAVRGGIPVCWPWFGKAATPSHGFARTSEWSLSQHRENENGVIVTLTLEDNQDTREIWPHKFHNQMTFEMNAELNVSLTSTNTDTQPWSFGGALHTYFNIADINNVSITGMGHDYLDSTQMGKVCQGSDVLTFSAETDRVYTHPQPTIMIDDKNNQRTITVTNDGDNAAVIWNPWQELSINMADMANNSFETMVCVESTIHTPTMELQPGQTHTLSTRIAVNH